MERQVNMDEVSDGKLYTANDMARLGCNDCEGCSKCCHGMGNSIVLDPYDVARMTNGLQVSFEELLAKYLELNVVDGIILPNIRMTEEQEQCGFLNESGRCSVHEVRPGICRMFPLGRIYENEDFRYFLQVHECERNNTKVKIKKWLDTPNIVQYEAFIREWHFFLKDLGKKIISLPSEQMKQYNMLILKIFFFTPYSQDINHFYIDFENRMKEVKTLIQDLA